MLGQSNPKETLKLLFLRSPYPQGSPNFRPFETVVFGHPKDETLAFSTRERCLMFIGHPKKGNPIFGTHKLRIFMIFMISGHHNPEELAHSIAKRNGFHHVGKVRLHFCLILTNDLFILICF